MKGSVHYDNTIFDEFIEDNVNIQAKADVPICLIGDFNARTGLMDNFLELEQSISNKLGLPLCQYGFNSKCELDLLGVCTERYNADKYVNN